MIIRKPYAFLIKNFKKIHIILLIFSLFVGYKLLDVNQYVREFMRLGTYDAFGDPISKHINGFLIFVILFLIIGSASLLILLLYKQKPWKIYLIPIIEYTAILLILFMVKNFFNIYTNRLDMADLRLTQDLLLISSFLQVVAIAIFGMRIFGIGTKKLQFSFDKEFLELSEEDREEVEIGINIDKYTFIRGFKRVKRYLKYFYYEHKSICNTFFALVILCIGFSIYKFFFVTNKSYTEGEKYNVNGYTFIINNAYITDKDYAGNIIDETNNFVIIDLTVTNHSEKRTLNLEYFHLKNATQDYVTTNRVFSNEFQDLGTAYESKREMKRGETQNFIIIYKVDKALETSDKITKKKNKVELKKNKFVLFYQEKSGTLRKIVLQLKDLSTIEKGKTFERKEDLTIKLKGEEETISFDYCEVVTDFTYSTRDCEVGSCLFEKEIIYPNNTYNYLKIDFSSDTFEAKNMIDFLKNYGKLNYIDDKGKKQVLEIEDPVGKKYYGKSVYIKVPKDLKENTEVEFELIIRNKNYTYKLY